MAELYEASVSASWPQPPADVTPFLDSAVMRQTVEQGPPHVRVAGHIGHTARSTFVVMIIAVCSQSRLTVERARRTRRATARRERLPAHPPDLGRGPVRCPGRAALSAGRLVGRSRSPIDGEAIAPLPRSRGSARSHAQQRSRPETENRLINQGWTSMPIGLRGSDHRLLSPPLAIRHRRRFAQFSSSATNFHPYETLQRIRVYPGRYDYQRTGTQARFHNLRAGHEAS